MSNLTVTRNEVSPCKYNIDYESGLMNIYIDIRMEPKGTLCTIMSPGLLKDFMGDFKRYSKKSEDKGLVDWMNTEFMLCEKIKDHHVPMYHARIMDLYFGESKIPDSMIRDGKLYYPAKSGVTLFHPQGFEFTLDTKAGSVFEINFLRTGDVLIKDHSMPTFEGQHRSYRITANDVTKYILDITFSSLDAVPGYTYDEKMRFLRNIHVIADTRAAAIQNRIVSECDQLIHVFSSVYRIDEADMNDPNWKYDKVENERKRYALHIKINTEKYGFIDLTMYLGFILADEKTEAQVVLYGYIYEQDRLKIIDEYTLSYIKDYIDPATIMHAWLYEEEDYILSIIHEEVFGEDLTIKLGSNTEEDESADSDDEE